MKQNRGNENRGGSCNSDFNLENFTGMGLYTRRDKDVRTNSGRCFSHANPIQQRVKCYLIFRKRKKKKDVGEKRTCQRLVFGLGCLEPRDSGSAYLCYHDSGTVANSLSYDLVRFRRENSKVGLN